MNTDRTIRDGVLRAMSVSALGTRESFLTYAGILPVNLPNGTRFIIYPDTHIPAHNRRLFWAVNQFAADYKPHVNIAIGDWSDIFGLSRHPKPLRAIVRPQDELDESRRLWDELMDISGAEWGYIILGNHEDRIYRFLQDMAPQLGSIVTAHNREPLNFHNLMGFTPNDNTTFLYGVEERSGFEGGMCINGDLNLHHGIIVKPQPGASAFADMMKWQWNIGHGHTHRMGLSAVGSLRSYEFGHLVDMDHAYMAYARKMFPNWAPGLAAGIIHNGKPYVTPIPVIPMPDARDPRRLGFVWDGTVYVESDR
ncbi:MAG: hypothetical protein K2X27_17575 [Candidatus Obscuribacterales bacterium]|nr:hypothetical protein [Candidatus Obscuribacterales bacterium]